jgi:transposase-like protein
VHPGLLVWEPPLTHSHVSGVHTPEHPSQWAAIRSVGEKLGIRTESLRRWVRQAERDTGTRAGLTTTEREELKRLQRENVELKRANEILRKASRRGQHRHDVCS